MAPAPGRSTAIVVLLLLFPQQAAEPVANALDRIADALGDFIKSSTGVVD